MQHTKASIAKMLATRKRNRELRQTTLLRGVKVSLTCSPVATRSFITIDTNLSTIELFKHLRAIAGPGEVA